MEKIEQELREIANSNLRDKGDAGALARQIIFRLNERRGEELLPLRSRVENALGLLEVFAFTITKTDVDNLLYNLSQVCEEQPDLNDVLIVDSVTNEETSLRESSPELSEEEKVLRENYFGLLDRLEIQRNIDDFKVKPDVQNNGPKMG